MGEQVAGDGDQIGRGVLHQRECAASGGEVDAGSAEMQVGDVGDPEAVEVGGQTLNRDRAIEANHRAGLGHASGRTKGSKTGKREEEHSHSVLGSGRLTYRLLP